MRSKRLLATLLTLTMIVSGVPSAAIAAETGDIAVQAEEQQYNDVEAQDSVEDGVAADVTEVPAETTEESAPAETVSEEAETVGEEVPVVEETPAEVVSEVEPMTFEGRANGVKVFVEASAGAFEEGTIMTVKKASAQDVIDAINDSDEIDIEVKTVKAVDITFSKDGEEVQPALPISVKLTSDLVAQAEAPIVVHVDDEGVAEEITETESVDGEDNAIAFEAEHFSVYAIIEEGSHEEVTKRATYKFYEADGTTPFVFKDAAGNNQTSQILKDGEVLEDVGIPSSASQNAKFVGWFDENGNKVEVNEAKTVTATTTIKLTAKMQGIVNVLFVTAVMKDDQGNNMSRSVVTVKQVEYTVGQTDPITVDTSDVTTEAPTSEQAVVGWNTDETAANAGTVEGTNGVITLYANGSAANIKDVTVFPAIQNAYWLYFDENDGGTGGGASYTPPQFVMIGGKPTKPTDPHRTGYTFGGWYKDAACTQGQEFDFEAVMTATTTVYAKWTGSSTTYTIIVKVQSTSDSAKINSSSNLSHSAKTYDFWKAYTIKNVQTGGTATVANTYKNLANQIDSSGYITYETCDEDKTIAADGSTVLYVYYQRSVMIMYWQNSSNSNSVYDTYYGLYDASLEEAGYEWKTDRKYRDRSHNLITIIDEFKEFTDGTYVRLYPASTNSYRTITMYKEDLDGSWVVSNEFEPSTNNSNFNLSNKYKGFELYQYRTDGGSWRTASVNQSVSYYNTLEIRFKRKTYDIEYHNGVEGAEGEIVRTDAVMYQAPLNGHDDPSVTYPVEADAGHYDFIGWFADSGWKTMVTFSELDEQTKNNYRNWYGIVEFAVISQMPANNIPLYAGYALKGWDCALDPNGGEFTNASQAGVFWLEYGEKFSSDIKTNISREGYIFQGWMVANVTGELNVVTKNGLRYVGSDSNWTMTDEPWEFSTGIEGPTYLMAKWFYKTSMSVVYDAGEGSDPPEDKGAYSDHATTVAFAAPIAPNNANFLGWDIQGTDTVEKLKPGDTFEVSSDYAVDGVVTLKAVYSSPGTPDEVPVTHITWYDNFTENPVENKNYYTNNELKINEDVAIMPATTFTREGYKFAGWARVDTTDGEGKPLSGYKLEPQDLGEDDLYLIYVEDENGGHFVTEAGTTVTKVAADENYPYHDLYAVWKSAFYVYHSGVDGGNLETYVVDDYPNGFDLTSVVTDDTLYGGYYLEGGFTKPDDSKAYNGINWTWTTAQTAPGNAITPVGGTTYYIKEVPTCYLNPYMHYSYTKADNSLKALILISAVDDLRYGETGYVLQSANQKARVSSTIKVTNIVGGKTVTLKASTVFRKNGIKSGGVNGNGGYLTSWEATKSAFFAKDQNFTMTPYWVTLDGIEIKGTITRTIHTGDLTYGTDTGIWKEDN